MKPLRHIRTCILLITGFFCSHCAVLPQALQNSPAPLAPNQQQIIHRQQWLAQSDLSHAQWLLDQQYLLGIPSNIKPGKIKQEQQNLYKQQERLAAQLLIHCQALSADAAPLLLTQCHNLLSKLPLNKRLAPQLQNLKKPRFTPPLPLVSNTPAPSTPTPSSDITTGSSQENETTQSNNIITNTSASPSEIEPREKAINTGDLLLLCQQNAQKNKWSLVRLQLSALRGREDLSPNAVKKINFIERRLLNALEDMENRAEFLYQNKNIVDAQHIWLEILQITPDKQDIRNKYQRAQTVLDNIEILRQQPNSQR